MIKLNQGISFGSETKLKASFFYEWDRTNNSKPYSLIKHFQTGGVVRNCTFEMGHCPVSNNGFGSFWFGVVLVGHGVINCLASESFFVVSFS